MDNGFAIRLLEVRKSKRKPFDKSISQEDAARLFDVSLSCYRKWEMGATWPDRRSRIRLEALWPEVFDKQQ